MNGYADDLAAVIETLDLNESRTRGPFHWRRRSHTLHRTPMAPSGFAAAVLIGAVPPLMVKNRCQSRGAPRSKCLTDCENSVAKEPFAVLQRLCRDVLWYQSGPAPKVSQGALDQFWLWSMQAGLENSYESIKAFSETDFHEDLKKFDVPTLVMHGEDDQIVPINISGKRSAKLIKGAKELFYPGLPHGLTATHQDEVNADLLTFVKSVQARKASSLNPSARGEGWTHPTPRLRLN